MVALDQAGDDSDVLESALQEAGILLLAAAALGCIYTAATERGFFSVTPPTKTSVRSGDSTPSMINRDEAWKLYQAGTALFVDARHEFDYKLGHIRGAVSVPLNDYDVRKWNLDSIPKDRVIVAYCDGAECNSSIELSARLMKDGYANVRIFFGGWSEWESANLPTEKSP